MEIIYLFNFPLYEISDRLCLWNIRITLFTGRLDCLFADMLLLLQGCCIFATCRYRMPEITGNVRRTERVCVILPRGVIFSFMWPHVPTMWDEILRWRRCLNHIFRLRYWFSCRKLKMYREIVTSFTSRISYRDSTLDFIV